MLKGKMKQRKANRLCVCVGGVCHFWQPEKKSHIAPEKLKGSKESNSAGFWEKDIQNMGDGDYRVPKCLLRVREESTVTVTERAR